MKIVAIYAHPDDGEVYAGGSLAKWASEGHEVYAICCTNGNMGTKLSTIDPDKLAEIRKRELNAALNVLGCNEAIGFWFPDGFLREHRQELKEKLTYYVRKLKPDRIVTIDPWQRYEVHPDHIEAGLIASEVAVFAGFPLFYPEQLKNGLEPHQPDEVWFMIPTSRNVNRIVDITETFEQKVQSFLCHESQVEMLADMFLPTADPTSLTQEDKESLEEGVRNFLSLIANGFASPYDCELAEAFYAVKCGLGHFDDVQDRMMEILPNLTQDVEFH